MTAITKIEGFDAAIIKESEKFIKYSIYKCIEIISYDMEYIEAVEHFYFNIKPNNTKNIKWK